MWKKFHESDGSAFVYGLLGGVGVVFFFINMAYLMTKYTDWLWS